MTAKESIRQAFKELLTQHSLDHITVIQICDQANVNRQTFYYHYQNMVHLLEDMIFLEIYDEVNKGKSYDTWKYGFITTLNFIENNHDIFLNIYHSSYWEEANRFFNKTSDALLRGVVDECIREGGYQIREEDKQFVIDYYRIIFTGLITEWTESGRGMSPKHLLQKFEKMIDGTIPQSLQRFSGA